VSPRYIPTQSKQPVPSLLTHTSPSSTSDQRGMVPLNEPMRCHSRRPRRSQGHVHVQLSTRLASCPSLNPISDSYCAHCATLAAMSLTLSSSSRPPPASLHPPRWAQRPLEGALRGRACVLRPHRDRQRHSLRTSLVSGPFFPNVLISAALRPAPVGTQCPRS
jgi:hypothetical protein